MFLISSHPFSVVGPNGKIDFVAGVTKDAPAWLSAHGAYMDAHGARLQDTAPEGWVDPEEVAKADAEAAEAARGKAEKAAAEQAELVELLSKENDDLRRKVGDLQRDLNAAGADAEIKNNEITALRAERDALKSDLAAARAEPEKKAK